jgi:hypothetical protein
MMNLKGLESGHGLIEALAWLWPGESEENHNKLREQSQHLRI